MQSSTVTLPQFNEALLKQVLQPVTRDAPDLDLERVVQSLVKAMAAEPARWLEMQNRYYSKFLELWMRFAAGGPNDPPPALVEPEPGDRRFRASEWQQPYFSLLAQAYLLSSRWLAELVQSADLEPRLKRKLVFFARQYSDAVSPANFPWSNPEAIKAALDTQGESVVRGMRNLAEDLARGVVSMTDASAFEVGRNLALTPGAVIFENDFMQLIQYRPQTESVFDRPLVIVPPCINKYYILDLAPENSFVRYALEQGHTVFMVSWRNMPDSMGGATWDDYLEHGVVRALEAAGAIAGTDRLNALGFCVGGTLLGCALAVLRAKGDARVASLTMLATMLDFGDTGELSVFVDEAYVLKRELEFARGGLLPGRELAVTFASLRANDLIWHYVANNYLKGRTPDPFDLLYWNSDSTNLPGTMYAYYIRNMYLENNLRVPGKLTMCGVPVDVRKIDVPAYVLATREDHIVPWRTAYASARLLGRSPQFVLGASGHIAGVVNPASRNRRNYWVGGKLPKDPERWLARATSHTGSWWPHWSAWVARHAGARVPARAALGGAGYVEIEPAPGRYVKEKA